MKQPTILIIGATGKVGSAALENLRQQDDVKTIAAVRTLEQKQQFEAEGVPAVKLDLDDPSTLPSALSGIDRLLLLTGYSVDMLKQSKRVIDAAKQAGVQHIVHVGASGNATSEVAHWGWHRMVEAYIEQQGFSYTHLQPEAFMQNLTAFGWLAPGQLTNLIGEAVWSWVDAKDVGLLAAAALARPEEFSGQSWRLGYDQASMSDLATQLTNTFSKQVETSALAPEVFYQGAVEMGADPAYMACIRDQFILNSQGLIEGAEQTFDPEAFEKATGKAPTDWAGFIQREAEQLSGILNQKA